MVSPAPWEWPVRRSAACSGSSRHVGSAQAWLASAAGWRADADPCLANDDHAAEVPLATGTALSSGSQLPQNELARPLMAGRHNRRPAGARIASRVSAVGGGT